MFVADERVSFNKPEIKRTKWRNTQSSGISGGRNKRCKKRHVLHGAEKWSVAL
jgi:hypothetical protein